MDGVTVARMKLDVARPGFAQILKSTIIVAVIFVIVAPSVPFPLGPGLDFSWILGLSMAHRDKLVFGRDIVFTHGPLGYLMMPAFPEAEPWGAFAFTWGIALVTAYALWRLCRHARHWTELCLYLGVFWVYSAFGLDSPLERPLGAVIALTLAVAIRWDESPWFDLGLLFFLAAVTLLAKFNIGIVASLAAFYFAACFVWRDRRTPTLVLKPTSVVLAVWLFSLAGLYWILDGTLVGLVSFLRNSIEIANGYSEAMGVGGPLWMAVGAVVGCLALWIVVPLAAGSVRHVVWGVPLLIVIGFLCFKSAMVRQDAHALPFPFEMAALALLVVALASTLRSRIAVGTFAMASLALGIGTVAQLWPANLPTYLDRLSGVAAFKNLDAFLHWPTTVSALESATQQALVADQIPTEFAPYVTGKRVGAYPWEIAMIEANHLQWEPLPVIQAYSAYTPALDSLNAEKLEAASGPEAILLTWGSIDGRQPVYEAPRSWRELFDWYDLKLKSRNGLRSVALLTRRSSARFGTPIPAGTAIAHWGQEIALPPVADDEVLVMEADVAESLKGILKHQLFRAPIVDVRVTLRSGTIDRRRVLRSNLRNGAIATDWPRSLSDLASMFQAGGVSSDRVVSLSFHSESPGELNPPIRIRWSRLKLRPPVT